MLDTNGSDIIQLTLPLSEVQQLRSVLPWLVQALDERPNLTAKQRQRRRLTRQALSTLLARIGESPPVPQMDEADA
jgi:hypothetical protein